MEEDTTNKPDIDSGNSIPVAGTVISAQPAEAVVVDQISLPEQQKPKKSKRKLFVIIGLIVAVFVALTIATVIILTPYIMGILAIGFFAVGCNDSDKKLDKTVSALKAEMDSLNTTGYTVDNYTVGANGDCLTGSGAEGRMEISINEQSVDDVNNKLAKSVFGNSPVSANFAIHEFGGNTIIDGVQTTMVHGSQTYKVTYMLPKSIYCMDNAGETIPCSYQRDPIAIYSLNTAKVNKIVIEAGMN